MKSNKSFDITLAFDKEGTYLNPQIYLFVDAIKDKIPDGTVLHVVTNRRKDNPQVKYIMDNINSKYVYQRPFKELESRCQFMLNCFKIRSKKPWIIKLELDLLFLKHLSLYEDLLEDDLDIVVESENRKIFPDKMEKRLWRMMYNAMNMEVPTEKITFREDDEQGLPLFGTGLICVKNELLNKINERWVLLTKKTEPWLKFGVHSNEQAMTGLILDEEWKWKIYPRKYKLNPIGLWRDGLFPSTKLIENCILPQDTICLDWHRWSWLKQIADANPEIKEIVDRNRKYIPDDVWNTPFEMYHEK